MDSFPERSENTMNKDISDIKSNSGFQIVLNTVRKRKLRFLYGMLVLVTVIVTFATPPHNLFVRMMEKTPFGTGLFISATHFVKGEELAAVRAFTLCIVMHMLLLFISLLFCLILWLLLFLKRFRNKNAAIVDDDLYPLGPESPSFVVEPDAEPEIASKERNQKLNKLSSSYYFRRLLSISVIAVIACISLFLIIEACWESVEERETKFQTLSPIDMTLKTDWMKNYRNQTIFDLTIPGSHDSHAIKGNFQGGFEAAFFKFIEPLSATQEYTIREQLDFGIRFLDIRLCDADIGEANVCHGPLLNFGTLENVLKQVNDFVAQNPSEMVILAIKIMYSETAPDEVNRREMLPVFLKFDEFMSRLVPSNNNTSTIGELVDSGKNIILLSQDERTDGVFEDITDLWSSLEFWRNLWKSDIASYRTSAKEYLTELLCDPAYLNTATDTFVIYPGQITGRIENMIHEIMPLLAHFLYSSEPELSSDVLEFTASIINFHILELLRDGNCTNHLSILTTDFIHESIILKTIERNG